MALVPARMAQSMFGIGTGKRFIGPRFFQFCTAVANAAVKSVVGKPFATTDVGLIIGIGVGNGVGIKALIPSFIQMQIFSQCASFGFIGPRLLDICDVIAQATVLEMNLATLTSSHAPVYLGTGTVIPGSIPVVGAEWTGNLITEGAGIQFIGPRWPNFCQAIGIGSASNFPTATGIVVITGTWLFLPIIGLVPTTIPGAGAGAGVIS